MKLEQNIKNEIAEIVKMSFESGHFLFDEMEIAYTLAETYPEKNNEELKQLLKLCIEYHTELRNLGPVGFYEEFRDTLDFDPMFVNEYGHYYDEDEEDYKFVVHFDEDGQNLDCWCEDKEFAIEYAKRHIDCGPVIYEIDEESGVENAILFVSDLEEEE